MDELIKAATAFFKAGAAYYEKQNALLGLAPTAAPEAARPEGQETGAQVARTRKPRAPKEEKAAAPAQAAPVAPLAEMTEEQSGKEVYNYAKNLIQRYPKPVVDGTVDKDNNPFPEGYHMARKILAEGFKVGKIADLVHAQRVQFITQVRALIAKADGATPAQPAGDVGIGV